MAFQTTSQEITVPAGARGGAAPKVKVEVQLIPVDQLPDILHGNTNVTKVTVGGQEFFAVVGKTVAV